MRESIHAFGEALEAVLTFTVDHVLKHVHSHAKLAWQDFDEWLIKHKLTLSQFLNYVMLYTLGAMLVGFSVACFGLTLGSCGFLDAAQFFVLSGMVLTIVLLLPLVLIFFLARRIFELIFHTGRACVRLLEDENHSNLPARIRVELEQLQGRNFFPVQTVLALYLGTYILLCMFPTVATIKYLLIAGAAGYCSVYLRNTLQIKGWAMKHLLYALAISFFWFSIPTYFFVGWLNSQSAISKMYHNSDSMFYIQLAAAAVVFITACVPLYFTTRSKEGDHALDTGDVQRGGYKKKPTGFDENGHMQFAPSIPKSKTKWILAILVIGVFFIWTNVLGYQNPLNSLFSLSFKNLMLLGIFGSLAFAVYFAFFWTEETPSVTTTKHEEVHKK